MWRRKRGPVEYVQLGGFLDGGDLIYFSCGECGFCIETSWGPTGVPAELAQQANELDGQVDRSIVDGFINGVSLYETAEHRLQWRSSAT